jgi:hypothetical protein
MATPTEAEIPGPEEIAEATTVDRLERLLDVWRGRIDELMVQADLASKEVAGAVRSQAAVAENAYLAARNRLKEIPKDAGSNLGSMKAGFDKLLGDMREAYKSAEAVIRRGSGS